MNNYVHKSGNYGKLDQFLKRYKLPKLKKKTDNLNSPRFTKKLNLTYAFQIIKITGLDGGDGCTAMGIYLIPANYILKTG